MSGVWKWGNPGGRRGKVELLLGEPTRRWGGILFLLPRIPCGTVIQCQPNATATSETEGSASSKDRFTSPSGNREVFGDTRMGYYRKVIRVGGRVSQTSTADAVAPSGLCLERKGPAERK